MRSNECLLAIDDLKSESCEQDNTLVFGPELKVLVTRRSVDSYVLYFGSEACEIQGKLTVSF